MSGLAALWAWARCTLGKRLRRRGAFLLTYGLIWVAYGVAIGTDPATPFVLLNGFGSVLDSGLWAALWCGCGLAAAAGALRRPRSDALGYNALLLPPAVWSLAYAWAGVLWLGSAGAMGSGRAWASAVIWSSAVVSVLIVAGWPEAPRDGGEC